MKLFDHQRSAVDRLQCGNILCGGVGTGKSLTALAYYYEKVCGGTCEGKVTLMKRPRDLYIITTARKRDTMEWQKEMLPFPIEKQAKVVIDSWNNIKKYVGVSGAFFLFDEDKVIGNGVWVKAFYKIAAANHWIILTATPGDVWADYIPVFVANGFYKNRTEFLNMHAIYDRYSKYPRIDRYMEQGRLMKFRDRILVNMDYDKPARQNHIDIPVQYDRFFYKSVQMSRKNPETGKPIKNASEFAFCMRKIVNSDFSRSEAVLSIVREHPKVIIFYNFNYELDILRLLPYPAGTEIAEWNGSNHQLIPRGDRWVYLVQYTAGCEGWNCVETDTIIFYSLNHSYKVMVQAAGRIDRLNTPFRDLYYYRLKSSSPVDIGISRALKQKKNFNESRFFSAFTS